VYTKKLLWCGGSENCSAHEKGQNLSSKKGKTGDATKEGGGGGDWLQILPGGGGKEVVRTVNPDPGGETIYKNKN